MEESLLIKYEYQSDNGFDLALLGSSFVGFDKVLKEIIAFGGLTDKVEIKTTRVQQGSVEIFNAIISLDPLFIQNPSHLIDFLKIAGPELINGVNSFLGVKDSLNAYYAKNPLDFEVHLLVTAYIVRSLIIAGKTKKGDKAMLESTKATPRQISRLKKLVNRGYFKKALAPITQGNVSKVEIKNLRSGHVERVAITEENVGDFLPDEEMVLPEFNDGDMVKLSGELQMLGSTHGDSMKIRIRDIDPENNLLSAVPAEGVDIVGYSHLFKQAVYIDAEIRRKTMFKKPDLIIHNMTSLQEKLDI